MWVFFSPDDSTAVKVACYILIGVGAFSMLMGFLGCVGAIYEVRCLLGLVSSGAGGSGRGRSRGTCAALSVDASSPQYFTCLLLILLAQIAAGALIYFQKEAVSDGSSSSSVTHMLITHLSHAEASVRPETSS